LLEDGRAVGVVIGVFAAMLIALAAALPGTADAGGLKDCGDAVKSGAGSYDVRASKNVSCPEAKRVARRFFPGGDDRFDKWRCEGRQVAEELGEGKCGRYAGRRRQIVKFIYGA